MSASTGTPQFSPYHQKCSPVKCFLSDEVKVWTVWWMTRHFQQNCWRSYIVTQLYGRGLSCDERSFSPWASQGVSSGCLSLGVAVCIHYCCMVYETKDRNALCNRIWHQHLSFCLGFLSCISISDEMWVHHFTQTLEAPSWEKNWTWKVILTQKANLHIKRKFFDMLVRSNALASLWFRLSYCKLQHMQLVFWSKWLAVKKCSKDPQVLLRLKVRY